MAEGDRFVDEAGNEYVEGPGGRIVQAIGELPEEVSQFGPAAIAGVGSAAKDTALIGAGIQNLLGHAYGIVGLDTASEAAFASADAISGAREAMTSDFEIAQQQDNPIGFFSGQMLGSALPGRAALQAGFGLTQGFGIGRTGAERSFLGGLGALGGAAGARVARRTTQAVSTARQMAGTAAERTRAQSARMLAREGVPMTESDLASEGFTGGPARTRDMIRDTLDPGSQDLAKRRALTGVTTETILPGTRQDIIDDVWLTRADQAIDEGYSALRAQVGPVNISDPWVDRSILNMMERVEELPPSVRDDAQFFIDEIIGDISSGNVDGQWWTGMRSRINQRARSSQDFQESQALYGIREQLDQLVSQGDPEFIAQLNRANEQFRLVEPLHRRGVINQATGTINPLSYTRAMRDMFPGVYRTTFEQSARGKKLFDLFSAASRFPAFRSSGTAERLTAGNLVQRAQSAGRLALGNIPEAIGGGAGRRAAVEAGQTTETSQEEEE